MQLISANIGNCTFPTREDNTYTLHLGYFTHERMFPLYSELVITEIFDISLQLKNII